MKRLGFLVYALAGCSSGAPCDSMHDCPPTGVECVIALCIDGVCQDVDLTTVPELPNDPESGLPIGKHCRQCQCADVACQASSDGTPCAFCDLLGECVAGACAQVQAGPPSCE